MLNVRGAGIPLFDFLFHIRDVNEYKSCQRHGENKYTEKN